MFKPHCPVHIPCFLWSSRVFRPLYYWLKYFLSSILSSTRLPIYTVKLSRSSGRELGILENYLDVHHGLSMQLGTYQLELMSSFFNENPSDSSIMNVSVIDRRLQRLITELLIRYQTLPVEFPTEIMMVPTVPVRIISTRTVTLKLPNFKSEVRVLQFLNPYVRKPTPAPASFQSSDRITVSLKTVFHKCHTCIISQSLQIDI
jgi:hypothetical protein